MHPAMHELSQLPIAERLAIVQQLWDSIGETKDQLPEQSWRREILNARLADFDGKEEATGLTREQVWQEVDRRRGSYSS